jgi:ribosomal protein L37AE/L43A
MSGFFSRKCADCGEELPMDVDCDNCMTSFTPPPIPQDGDIFQCGACLVKFPGGGFVHRCEVAHLVARLSNLLDELDHLKAAR